MIQILPKDFLLLTRRLSFTEARRVWHSSDSVQFKNGGFEEFEGNTFKGYNFHDRPGQVSFAADTEIPPQRQGFAAPGEILPPTPTDTAE